ncbi:MAG: hypothetical protein LBT59_20275, partial [Clostridiales bacterium]|jgi:hypothetical protein|nr:hypothetical protein [Clostridiales bacterium]
MDNFGYPHLTFITSIQGLGEDKMTFGKFCEGLSKKHIESRPDSRFIAISADMRWLRGSMSYIETKNTGEVFDEYNNKPLFRYNSYFGFSKVYFCDLIDISEIQKLPMPQIALGGVLSRAKALVSSKSENNALSVISRQLFGQFDGLKFLCWAEDDKLSGIVPIVQATNAGTDRIAFSGVPYGELITAPKGAKAAILALNLKMQSVLAKGSLESKGILSVEQVYNSMPPKSRVIYPMEKRPIAVTEF